MGSTALLMKIDAATRAALQRRKKRPAAAAPSVDQINDVREATKNKFKELLGNHDNSLEIATEIEEQLFEDKKGVNADYRSGFRRLFTSLKNEKAGFVDMLLSGEITGREFSSKSVEELKSVAQQQSDQALKKEAIDKSIAQQLLPETIQQLKDGRDREKWGVSRSAAALDD